MKRAEKILGLIFLLSFILKLIGLPWSGLLILLSLTFLSGLYFCLGFALFNDISFKKIFKKESYLLISKIRIIGSVLLGIVLSIMTLGILFRVYFFYSGYNIILLVTLIQLFVILILCVAKFIKRKSDFYKRLIIRILIIGSFAIVMLSIRDLTLVNIQHRNHPEYVKAFEFYVKDRDNIDNQIPLKVEYLRLKYSDNKLNNYLENNMDSIKKIMTEKEIKYYIKKYKK